MTARIEPTTVVAALADHAQGTSGAALLDRRDAVGEGMPRSSPTGATSTAATAKRWTSASGTAQAVSAGDATENAIR